MLSSLNTKSSPRWPRGQRFALSPSGTEAEAGYRTALQVVRALGREALESAERRWAEPLGLQPCDGVVLTELRLGELTLPQLRRSLECCGTSEAQTRDALDRLVRAGYVAASATPRAVA
jgi:hypothetical protein